MKGAWGGGGEGGGKSAWGKSMAMMMKGNAGKSSGPYADPWGVAGNYDQNLLGPAIPAVNPNIVHKAREPDWGETPIGPPPTIHWLEFALESPLVQAGFAPRAPALLYDKQAVAFQSAHHILQCVADINTSVALDHDEEWEKYPGVGELFKAHSGEENCYAVASSAEHGKWAVGFHAGKKGREAAAKLALAIAIAAGTPNETLLRANYPEFGEVLDGPSASAAAALQRAAAASAAASAAKLPEAMASVVAALPLFGGVQQALPAAAGLDIFGGRALEVGAPPMPTNTVPVCSLTIPLNSAIVLQGLTPEPPAIVYDKEYGRLFGSAGKILTSLVQHLAPGAPLPSIVSVTHDPDWKDYPEVGAALAPAGLEDDCYALAVCPTLVKWAVGIASGWDKREKAAYLALAIAVAAESPVKSSVMADYPEFSMMCVNAGMV